MKEFPATYLPTRELLKMAVSGEPAILYAGKPSLIRAYILPISKWSDAILDVYGSNSGADIIRISRDELSVSALMSIIMEQVTDDWSPGAFAILTLKGTEVAYVVPANSYWRERVEG